MIYACWMAVKYLSQDSDSDSDGVGVLGLGIHDGRRNGSRRRKQSR
jgi:hypothetical protein